MTRWTLFGTACILELQGLICASLSILTLAGNLSELDTMPDSALKSDLAIQITREDQSFKLSYEGGRACLTYADVILQSEFRGDWDQYEQVRKDSKVRAAMQKRTSWLTNYNWRIDVPESMGVQGDALREWATDAVSGMLNFNSSISGMLRAILLGYTVGEVVWETREGKWFPRQLICIPNRLMRFDSDGKLLWRKNVQSIYQDAKGPPKTYLLSWEDVDGLQLGNGLGESLYHYVWGKTEGWRNWFVFLSRFSQPIPIFLSDSPLTDVQTAALVKAGANIHNGMSAVLTNGVKVTYLEAERTGSLDIFNSFLEAINAEIAELILGQSLTQ